MNTKNLHFNQEERERFEKEITKRESEEGQISQYRHALIATKCCTYSRYNIENMAKFSGVSESTVRRVVKDAIDNTIVQVDEIPTGGTPLPIYETTGEYYG
jgi:AraC-like DNA-binding protein